MEKVKTEAFNTIVKKKIVSVTSKIIFVLRRLYKSGSCFMLLRIVNNRICVVELYSKLPPHRKNVAETIFR